MPEAKARLVAVSSEPAGPASTRSRDVRRPPWASRRGAGLLGLLAALLAVALVLQTLRVGEFESAVRGLTTELELKRAELEAHESRLARVRASVRELRAGLAGLSELVSPEAPTGAPPDAP